MKIDVYCLCKNEIKLLPFFIDYWKALADDVDVYIYDGNSTDGCREEFAKHDWIHVIDFETDALDDNNHRLLKNECWKQSRGKADFVMVSDFDETIFSYDVQTLREELIRMKTAGGTILLPLSFNLIPDTFPEYQEGKYLHELAQYGFNDAVWEAKPILFDPNNIDEYNVSLGGHTAFPTGNVKWYISKKLFLVHAKFLGYDYYEERIRQRNVSQWNLDNGIDGETLKTVDTLHKEFNMHAGVRFRWDDIPDNIYTYYNVVVDHSRFGGMTVRQVFSVSAGNTQATKDNIIITF